MYVLFQSAATTQAATPSYGSVHTSGAYCDRATDARPPPSYLALLSSHGTTCMGSMHVVGLLTGARVGGGSAQLLSARSQGGARVPAPPWRRKILFPQLCFSPALAAVCPPAALPHESMSEWLGILGRCVHVHRTSIAVQGGLQMPHVKLPAIQASLVRSSSGRVAAQKSGIALLGMLAGFLCWTCPVSPDASCNFKRLCWAAGAQLPEIICSL